MKKKGKKLFRINTVIMAVVGGVIGFWSTAFRAQAVGHGIAAANINVVQNDVSNNTASVTVTTTLSVNGFSIRPGSNRGDYNVQVGAGFSDDVDTGVLLTSVAQNGRDNVETAYPGVNYSTSAFDYSRTGGSAGGYWIAMFNAPAGAEYNCNVAGAFFPYAQWTGGYARNSGGTNGGANDLFTGSPGLVLGTHFVDNGSGVSTVNLTNLGIDSRTSGVLLVNHGGNEDNYATSMVNSNNGTWTVYIKDNGANQAANEQDPVGFVFVPKTNTTVVSGRFLADGTRLIFSGPTPAYNVTNTGTGTWRLTIPGQTPNSGVLIISAEGGFGFNQDNMITYEPDGDGWIIQTRDLPPDPPGLQTPTGEPVASFVFIPAAATVTPISPTNNSQNLGATPVLQAAVSNTAPGNLTVQFYGRVANINPVVDFTIVALPDTQFYTDLAHGGLPAMFATQTDWIVTNRVSRNIAYVVGLGDIVDHGDNNGGTPLTEWRNATNALYRLENPASTLMTYGIPYGTAVGNHDQSPNGDSTGTTTFYNQFFGVSHFAGKPYYAGHYGANNNNHFDFFSAGGMDFITIYLEYDVTLNPVWLNWANDVLRTNANRRAIIVTHNFGNTATPVVFSAQGAAIYNAVKTNANVFMMLAGHVTGEGSRVDTYNGNTIRTFVSDYQGWTNGGNGNLRIIEFSPTNNTVLFQTYSPWTDEYQTGPTSEFWFNYDMQQPLGTNNTPFTLIGAVSNVPPGGVASQVWSGRAHNTGYEWYAVVTDAANNSTTSPVWRFATALNSPPVVANTSRTIYGDSPTNLTLVATDANGDSLTFATNSLPQHGLLKNFNPATGAFTYQPIHGYRGVDNFAFSANDGEAGSGLAGLYLTIVTPPDTNANGLPDAWETYFGVSDPNADSDGDGRTNLQEYLADTNPTNAVNVLRFSSVTRAPNGHVTLVWPSVGGTRYRGQYSNGGTSGAFTDVVRPLTLEMDPAQHGSASMQTFVDDFTLTGGTPGGIGRNYRIKIVQ